MNKAFKVLWNDVRGSYVVSSENHLSHGKPAKSARTLVAAAVAGMLAIGTGSALAASTPVTNDSLSELGTTKFLSGKGELNIQTEGNADALAEAILKKDFGAIRNALGHNGQYATVVGAAGGQNYWDSATSNLLTNQFTLAILEKKNPTVAALVKKLTKELETPPEKIIEGSTLLTIGGESRNPLVVASAGADRLLHLGLMTETPDQSLTRHGDSNVIMNSGNSLLLVGASSAINVGEVAKFGVSFIQLPPKAQSTSVTLDGNSSVALNGSTSSLGSFAAGSALALGGRATSTVTGSSSLSIDTTPKGAGLEGLTIGAFGGGLSVGVLGGESSSTVKGKTTVSLQGGLNAGVFGGGLAMSGQVPQSKVDNLIPKDYKDNITLIPEAFGKGGTATAESQDISIRLGHDSSNAFVVGGGLAVAYQYDNADKASIANAKTGNIAITVGDKDAQPVFANSEEKGKYFSDTMAALRELKTAFAPALDDNPDTSIDKNTLKTATGKLVDALATKPGVNVGILGNGIAASWSRNASDAKTAPKASVGSETTEITIDVQNGYNVGIFGGGLAAASGDATQVNDTGESISKPSAVLAHTQSKSVTMNFTGGETIGVMGGGMAIAMGSGDMNYGTGALAEVGTVNIRVAGGSVDGIVGGGYALDDTNPTVPDSSGIPTPVSSKTASSTVDTVNIAATSGKIGRLAFDVVFGNNTQPPFNTTRPGMREYLDSMTYGIIHGKAGIIGGGIASGLRNETEPQGGAHVQTVNIALAGNTVVGEDNDGYRTNIYGGGLATDGAHSSVDTVNIQIGDATSQGPVIYGDIYGGGLAVDGRYGPNASYYNNAKTTVGETNIVLASGTVNGDIYAGGRVLTSADDEQPGEASAVVNKAQVTLLKNGVFNGKSIDAGGVTDTAALAFGNDVFDLNGAVVRDFTDITANGQVENFDLAFSEKTKTTLAGIFDVNSIKADKSSTLTLDKGGVLATKNKAENVTFVVNDGVLALGSDVKAKTAFEQLSSANAIPGLYLAGTVDLTGTQAKIGTVAEDATGVVIGADGSLMADAGGKTSVTGVVQGSKDSGIYFTNVATEGAQVAFGADALQGFDLDNKITVDNVRYEVVNTDNVFTFEQVTDQAQLYSLGLDGFDSAALDLIEKQTDTASQHVQALMDQQNAAIGGGDHRHAQLSAAFNLATAAGVQTAGIEAVTMGLDQTAKRASLTNTFNDGWTGFAEVTGTQLELGGDRSMLETKTKLGGLVAGGEYTSGDWTFGGLINLGTGEVKGQGHNGGVKNDVDFYGLHGYAAKRIGDFNIVGQLGALISKNDINHRLGDSADVDANVYTFGVRGETRFALSQNISLVPYVGLNYLRVETEDFTSKKGFKVGESDQDLVSVPVGVAITGTMASHNGWEFKPMADLAYVHTFGDTNVETATGVGNASMATDLDVWSENVARARIGMQAEKGNMGLGFTLGAAAGSDDHREMYGQINVKYLF